MWIFKVAASAAVRKVVYVIVGALIAGCAAMWGGDARAFSSLTGNAANAPLLAGTVPPITTTTGTVAAGGITGSAVATGSTATSVAAVVSGSAGAVGGTKLGAALGGTAGLALLGGGLAAYEWVTGEDSPLPDGVPEVPPPSTTPEITYDVPQLSGPAPAIRYDESTEQYFWNQTNSWIYESLSGQNISGTLTMKMFCRDSNDVVFAGLNSSGKPTFSGASGDSVTALSQISNHVGHDDQVATGCTKLNPPAFTQITVTGGQGNDWDGVDATCPEQSYWCHEYWNYPEPAPDGTVSTPSGGSLTPELLYNIPQLSGSVPSLYFQNGSYFLDGPASMLYQSISGATQKGTSMMTIHCRFNNAVTYAGPSADGQAPAYIPDPNGVGAGAINTLSSAVSIKGQGSGFDTGCTDAQPPAHIQLRSTNAQDWDSVDNTCVAASCIEYWVFPNPTPDGTPDLAPAPSGDVPRTMETTITCKSPDGSITEITGSTTASMPAGVPVPVAGLQCPDGDRIKTVNRRIVTPGGPAVDLPPINTPTELDQIPDACFLNGVGCVLRIQKRTPDGDWKTPPETEGWPNVENRPEDYRCSMGSPPDIPYVPVPLAWCRTLDPQPDPADPDAPPLVQPTPLPPADPGGNPLDPEPANGDCDLGWSDLFTGAVFVKGAKCVLKWAFVPSAASLFNFHTDIGVSFNGSAPGVALTAAGDLYDPLSQWETAGGDCMGPELNVPSVGINSWYPFAACEPPASTMSAFWLPLATILFWATAIFGAVRILGKTINAPTVEDASK